MKQNKDFNQELWDNWKEDIDEKRLMKAELMSLAIVFAYVLFIVMIIAIANNWL